MTSESQRHLTEYEVEYQLVVAGGKLDLDLGHDLDLHYIEHSTSCSMTLAYNRII